MSKFARTLFTLLVVSVLLLTMTGPAGAIVYGTPDGNRHPYIGLIFNDELACSGTAISETVVLTAAHCLEAGADFSVTFESQAAARPDGWPDASGPGVVTGTGYPITDFCLLTGTCGPGPAGYPSSADPDLAVVVLDEPVSLSRYAQLPTVGLVDTLPKKQPVTFVGYGVTDIARGGGQPTLLDDNIRRAAPGVLLPTGARLADDFISATAPGRTSLCYGDSGSPILLGDTILGVLSFSSGLYCTSPIYATRVDTADALTALAEYTG